MRRAIPLMALFLVGCGSAYLVDLEDQPNDLPTYYTESGVGRPFTEIQKISGIAEGPCETVRGLEFAALKDAQRKAKKIGADALLIPDSLSISGEEEVAGYCENETACLFFKNPWRRSGRVELSTLAIKYNKPKTAAPPPAPVEEKPKTTAPPRVLQPNEPTSSPAETETPSSTEEPEQPTKPEASTEAPEGDSAP